MKQILHYGGSLFQQGVLSSLLYPMLVGGNIEVNTKKVKIAHAK